MLAPPLNQFAFWIFCQNWNLLKLEVEGLVFDNTSWSTLYSNPRLSPYSIESYIFSLNLFASRIFASKVWSNTNSYFSKKKNEITRDSAHCVIFQDCRRRCYLQLHAVLQEEANAQRRSVFHGYKAKANTCKLIIYSSGWKSDYHQTS